MGLIIGGLPGWWVGRESGRKYSPAATLPEWNQYLLRSGFAGVETSTPVLDPVVMPACIIAAQAVDQNLTNLREPLSAPTSEVIVASDLVLLGGNTPETGNVAQHLGKMLAPYYKSVLQAATWENLQAEQIPKSCSVLCLSDLDAPFWPNITVDCFEKFKSILSAANCILWVSHGSDCDNPDSAMTYGFFRCLVYELPDTLIQFLDCSRANDVNTTVIAERLLRLEISSKMQKTGTAASKLWTTEPEVRLRERALIPRLYPDMEQNNRYNSAKREILKDVDLSTSIVSLNWNGKKHDLRKEERSTLLPYPDHRRVIVDASILTSLVTSNGRLFFSLGTDLDTSEHVLSVSTQNASVISIPVYWSVPVEFGRNIDAQYLSFLSGYIMSKRVASIVPVGGTCILFEADPGLASLLSRQLAEQGSRVQFITTTKGSPRRNWTYMHPRIADRHLAAALPKKADVYIDLSGVSSTAGSTALGVRISSMLHPLCEKYDASLLITPESSAPTHDDLFAMRKMLENVNTFAAAQLNGVPDGMPLRMVPVSEVVSPALIVNPISIVSWRGEAVVPTRIEPISCRKDLFSGDKTYWLVGLAGDMGRSLCNYMVEHGARHIVLTSRNPSVDVQWVDDHRLQGAEVVYIKGDISKRNDVQGAFKQIQANGMPPIAGVANGALVLRDKGLVNMDLETFHANTLCKVEGTEYLHELFQTNTLDWFIAFSSISATVGNMGQMAYAAANSFMKALIAQRRKAGLAGSTIDISQVLGVGYIEREMKLQTQLSREQAVRLMNKSGTIVMSEPDLHQLFAEAIVNGRADSDADHELISGIKTVTPAEAEEALWGKNVRFGHFIRSLGSSLPSVTRAAAVPVKKLLETARSEAEIASILKVAFVKKLKSSMMTGDDSILATTPLVDLGVDSLVAVEIRSWFKQEVGVDIAVLKILGGPSANELVEETAAKLVIEGGLQGESSDESTDHSATESNDGENGSGRQSPPTDVEEGVSGEELETKKGL